MQKKFDNIRKEMKEFGATRREMMEQWIKVREHGLKIAHQELQIEKEITEKAERDLGSFVEEDDGLIEVMARSEEIEDEKYRIRDELEKLRRRRRQAANC
jgi:hypothetical protein